ncbi:hypothetical protein E2320_002624 [Naja naja]|nr:hypothetical protein E2320_002624 [Naja naja]
MSEDVYVEPRKALQVSEEEDRRSTVVLEENEEYLDLTVLHMGGKLSGVQEQHIQELEKLADSVKSVGIKIHRKDIRKLLIYLWQQFPSYPEAGSLQVSTWKKIGKAMHQAPRAPAEQLVAWRKLMENLITHENPMELTSLIREELPHILLK